MYNSQDIALRIKSIAKERNIIIKNMLSECGLSKNMLSTMLSGGSMPKVDNLARIADYLDCSVDYLLGRDGTQNNNVVNGNYNVVGNTSSQINVNTDDKLTDEEAALLELFKKMDVINKSRLITYAAELDKK